MIQNTFLVGYALVRKIQGSGILMEHQQVKGSTTRGTGGHAPQYCTFLTLCLWVPHGKKCVQTAFVPPNHQVMTEPFQQVPGASAATDDASHSQSCTLTMLLSLLMLASSISLGKGRNHPGHLNTWVWRGGGDVEIQQGKIGKAAQNRSHTKMFSYTKIQVPEPHA